MTRGRWYFIAVILAMVAVPELFLFITAALTVVVVLLAIYYPFFLLWQLLGVDKDDQAWYYTGSSPYPKGTVGHTEYLGH
jgi:hypothetical protein